MFSNELSRLNSDCNELLAAHQRLWAMADAGNWDASIDDSWQSLGAALTTHQRLAALVRALEQREPSQVELVFGDRFNDSGSRGAVSDQILAAANNEGLDIDAPGVEAFLSGETFQKLQSYMKATAKAITDRVASLTAVQFVDSYLVRLMAKAEYSYKNSAITRFPSVREFEDLKVETDTAVESALKQVFNALNSNSTLAEIRTITNSGILDLQSRAEIIGGLLGVAVASFDQETPLRMGRAVADLRFASRRLAIALSYLAWSQAQAIGVDANRWRAAERRRATSRSFESVTPTGQSVSLAEAVSSATGLIAVEGWIHDLRVLDDPAPPKFSTFGMLKHGSDSLQIRAHMFSLLNNGLRDGAFCSIRGVIDRSGAESVLNVDRVALGDQRRRSWIDDITYRMRFAFWLYPDDMNLLFTPRYGEEGP